MSDTTKPIEEVQPITIECDECGKKISVPVFFCDDEECPYKNLKLNNNE